ATGRLLWSFDLYRRDKHHYRSPDAGQSAAADRTIRHQLGFRAADRLDLVATFAIVRFHRPFQPAQGIYGASIMPVAVLREMAQRLPKVRLWNLYGQTEIAPLATMLGPEDQLRKLGSCGRAVLNVETRVVDDAMRDVAPGEVGEIVHRSPHLMVGYFHDDERTAAAFEGGWFHSGDLATVDEEGYITVVDRKKDMIKTGGENVASREVEEALYRLPQGSEV